MIALVSHSTRIKTYSTQVAKTHLRLFEFLVIVGLQLHQGTKDVLVLIGVFVAQQHMLRLLVHTRLLQVLQGRRRVFLP